ncbi:MAG: SIMPL domain-containing protein [bacterium]|nr:SIMPL domain-containing protein [bacterium]MDE0439814.1 SIMPL domain-containing protein [bacterium]
MMEAIRTPGLRRMIAAWTAALVALALVSAPALTRSARANGVEGEASAKPVEVRSEQKALTELTVEGIGSRSVNYDGAIGRFTVSVLRDSLIEAVADGNKTVQAIADEVAAKCTEGEPEDADHTTAPTCISPGGLQTVGIRIQEEFDWTEQGRVSQGFLYENRLTIGIRGTGFAGGLVDMVITAGGDNVRFQGLDFTVSRRAEFERLALLDAIDDARATAQAIADHMGFEIVRIARMMPGSGYDPYGDSERFAAAESALDDSGSVPTPVFGGAETVTSRITMVFEIRPAP